MFVLYHSFASTLQRPPYGVRGTLYTWNIDCVPEGIVKPDDRLPDALRERDLGQRSHTAADGDEGLRRPHDQKIAHLAEPARARDVDIAVGRGGIRSRAGGDGDAARCLPPPCRTPPPPPPPPPS